MTKNRRSRKNKVNEENNEKLTKATCWLVIATILLVVVGGLQLILSSNLVDLNEKMTNITFEFYRYHPPDVSLTNGYIARLFVCQDKSMGTYITLYGMGEIYNSDQSNDIALVRPKKLAMEQTFDNGRIVIEGNRNYISIIPGEEPKLIPILVTYQINKDFVLNDSIDINVNSNISQIEVIHPLDKKILNNIKVLEPANISYKFGENTAKLDQSDYGVNIQVLYFEDYHEYVDMKKNILFDYGKTAVLI